MPRESGIVFEIKCIKENIAQRKNSGLSVDFEEDLLKSYQVYARDNHHKHTSLISGRSKR